MADMVRVTRASRNTLKDHFRSLVEKGHLTRHGSGKGSCIHCPEKHRCLLCVSTGLPPFDVLPLSAKPGSAYLTG